MDLVHQFKSYPPTFNSDIDMLLDQISHHPISEISISFASNPGNQFPGLSLYSTDQDPAFKLPESSLNTCQRKGQRHNNLCSSQKYEKKKGKNVAANIKEPIIWYFERLKKISYLPIQKLRKSSSASLEMLKNICDESEGRKIIVKMMKQKYLFREYQLKRFSSDRQYGLHFTRINQIQRSLLKEIRKKYAQDMNN